MANNIIPYNSLPKSDLIIDAIYEGGKQKNAGDDPISKLVGCGNQGGFRYKGSLKTGRINLCVLYSELADPDWPDALDMESGLFTYYGDNKKSGHEIHDTKKKGNEILRQAFNNLHTNSRRNIPPFFIFTKGPKGRDVIFRGLAVPGARGISQSEDLIAVWKTKDGNRFANYRAIFTILDVSQIPRAWLEDLKNGNAFTENTPESFSKWAKNGKYAPLLAPKSKEYRTKAEQLPETKLQNEITSLLLKYFKGHSDREYAFEKCAAELGILMDRNIVEYELTRFWRDGGRDAIGKYRIGTEGSSILVDFALEAKCKKQTSGSGVKEVSRLISRLRHRQFGIFVTTSYVSEQAYKEIIEDGHPVIVLAARDIANILIQAGYNSTESLYAWLSSIGV